MSAPALTPWLRRPLAELLRQRGHAWLLQGPSGLGQYDSVELAGVELGQTCVDIAANVGHLQVAPRVQKMRAAPQAAGRAAERAGFSSDTKLRRAWRQFGLPGSPSRQAVPARR